MSDMKQCKLVKDTQVQTSWIPAKFAIVGKILRVEDEEGWVVESVGGTLTKEMMKAQEKRARNPANFRSTK